MVVHHKSNQPAEPIQVQRDGAGVDLTAFNCLFIFGPTASGKSRLAVEWAMRYNGVIINADSMQVYEGVEILTATPPIEERGGIEHYLYNEISPYHHFDCVQWYNAVIPLIEQAHARGKLPILCGGTSLYATCMTQGMASIPDVKESVRKQVRHYQETYSDDDFYGLLVAEDPLMAQRLHKGDRQRIARALEIVRCTGKSLLYYQETSRTQRPAHIRLGLVCVQPDRQAVYEAINTRYEAMVHNGGLAEVERLIQRGVDGCHQLSRAIGVRELLMHYTEGADLDYCIEKAKINSRRYAKRQYTYMRTQLTPDMVYIPDL